MVAGGECEERGDPPLSWPGEDSEPSAAPGLLLLWSSIATPEPSMPTVGVVAPSSSSSSSSGIISVSLLSGFAELDSGRGSGQVHDLGRFWGSKSGSMATSKSATGSASAARAMVPCCSHARLGCFDYRLKLTDKKGIAVKVASHECALPSFVAIPQQQRRPSRVIAINSCKTHTHTRAR